MSTLAKIFAPLALATTLLASMLYLTKALAEGPMKLALLVATVVWFVFAPYWMKGGSK